MSGNVVSIGLGPRLADPASVWPATTVIEVVPEVARLLGRQPQAVIRLAIAAQAGVDVQLVEPLTVSVTQHGTALVRIARNSNAERALDVAARRRATNAAEALHAAILAIG